jgi:Glyoxalase-like domain
MLRFDHAVLAVRDLQASAHRLWEEHGLRAVPGGRHPRWGTANMIIPLGRDYVELLSVVEPDEGVRTGLGRTLLDLSAEGDRWFSVCLADDDIESTAARLGLTVEDGSRSRPDGTEIRWRSAGIEQRGDDLSLPFFIRWEVAREDHPAATPARHRTEVSGISWVEVEGDAGRLASWLGGADLPIRVVGRGNRVRAVALATAGGGDLILRA